MAIKVDFAASVPFIISIFIEVFPKLQDNYLYRLISDGLQAYYPSLNDNQRTQIGNFANDVHKRLTFTTSIFISVISAVVISSRDKQWWALVIIVAAFLVLACFLFLYLSALSTGELMRPAMWRRGGNIIRLRGWEIKVHHFLTLIIIIINILLLAWVNIRL
jgi:hypothetical protein